MRSARFLLQSFSIFVFGILASSALTAQTNNLTNATSTPIEGAGHNYVKLLSETVDPANGMVSVRIDAGAPLGRRLTVPFTFAYDSNGVWAPQGTSTLPIWSSFGGYGYLYANGWSYLVPRALTSSQLKTVRVCTTGNNCHNVQCVYFNNWTFGDPAGGRHNLGLLTQNPATLGNSSCHFLYLNQVLEFSGPVLTASVATASEAIGSLRVADVDGTTYSFSGTNKSGIAAKVEDRNGNYVTIQDLGGGAITATDTLGRTVFSTSGFGVSGNSLTISGLSPYTLTWGTTNYNFNTGWTTPDPNCGPAPAVNGTLSVVTAITLPNGKQYQFSYEPIYGLLNKITYPTGATVSYTWGENVLSAGGTFSEGASSCDYEYGKPAILKRIVSFDGITNALEQDFQYQTTWAASGSPPHFTSKQTVITTKDLVTGTTSVATYLYTAGISGEPNPTQVNPGPNLPDYEIPLEQTVTYQDGVGNTLRTVSKTWNNAQQLASQQTVLENGQTSLITYTYGPGSQVTERDEYDNGAGANGSLLRKTFTAYQSFAATPVFPSGASIFDLPCQTTVQNGSGTVVAETDFYYDGSTSSTPCSAATTQTLSGTGVYKNHDETLYGTAASVARGNLTKTVKKCFVGASACASGNPTTTFAFDETGQIISTTSPVTPACPSGCTTTFSFLDSYTVLSAGINTAYAPPTPTNAFLTQVTDPLSHHRNFSYDFNNSQLTVSTDPNGLSIGYIYNDSLARPTQANFPDGGQISTSYNDTARTITTSKKINTTQTLTTVAVADGVGHVTQTQLTSDPQGTVLTDTSFDGLGRVRTVSNPYRSGVDITTTTGTTNYTFDALGRKTLETYPDSSVLTTAYCGATNLVTDPTGHWRRSTVDALSRLIEVDEPNAPGASVNSNGCVGTGEPIWITSYTNDALGNLTQVVQNGSHQRTFSYDSLSHLLTAANPESGTITYAYNNDGTLLSKKDARNITTCFGTWNGTACDGAGYDVVNRLTKVTYSNADPTVTYTYDQPACLGLTSCQNIGQRTSAIDAAGSEAWSYQIDTANHRSLHVNQRITSSIAKTSTYYLDLAGNITQIVYPTGRIVNYTFDNANRPSTAADGSSGITYATGFKTSAGGTCAANVTCYTPQGTFYALSLGQTATFNGLNLTHSYNSRLQPLEFKAISSGGNAIDITYNFVDPATSKNAGHVYGITNNLDATRSQTFGYDQLNRIASAKTTSTHATSPAHCWGEAYTLDAWANLNAIAPTTDPAYFGCAQESGFSQTAGTNNRLSGFSYDASGNTSSDGVNAYTWNAESQLKTAAGVTYTYDGQGRRASKTGSKLYWYGSGGEILVETNTSGTVTAEYIFFGGQRVAMVPAGNTAQFYVEDLLGTSRVVTTNTGVVCYDADFYPYGGERPVTNTCTQNAYKFEGKERDAETGNDDFGARYYSNRFGRWLSSDWSAVPVAVPYANLTNPQTLNLYSMVADDPESFVDLDGHCSGPDDKTPDCQKLQNNPLSGLSAAVKQAINDSVKASNSKNDDDKKGGTHEEGGVSYKKDGKEVVAPSQPGTAKDVTSPGHAEIDPYKAADSSKQIPGDVQADVVWHVHPSALIETSESSSAAAPGTTVIGGTTTTHSFFFVQTPSDVDIRGAIPAPTVNIVVGARSKMLYIFDDKSTTKRCTCQESLKDFNKQP